MLLEKFDLLEVLIEFDFGTAGQADKIKLHFCYGVYKNYKIV